MNNYPSSIEPKKVGDYPAVVKSGGGYFFDEVLEYRVWCHPTEDSEGDYFYAFETYEEALVCSNEASGAEEPLVLIRQFEWVNEPETGKFKHEKGERIAEWRVEWLGQFARKPSDIEQFIKENSNHG